MIDFDAYVDSISAALQNLITTDSQNQPMDAEAGLAKWCRMTRNA